MCRFDDESGSCKASSRRVRRSGSCPCMPPPTILSPFPVTSPPPERTGSFEPRRFWHGACGGCGGLIRPTPALTVSERRSRDKPLERSGPDHVRPHFSQAHEQPGRKFTCAGATTRVETARLQVAGFGAAVLVHACRHLQLFHHSPSPHLRPNAPAISGRGVFGMARRGRCVGLIRPTPALIASERRRRDKPVATIGRSGHAHLLRRRHPTGKFADVTTPHRRILA